VCVAKEVRGKTLGIVGYGHIGSQVSVLAEAMGLKVIFFDTMKKLPLGNARSANHLGELLSEADFVTLHVPEIPETMNMIGPKEFLLFLLFLFLDQLYQLQLNL
jgi:D-3-phosphoglycerate dehydrogenase